MSYSTAVLALSPLRFYPFTDASGIVADDASTNAVDGTYYPGTSSWTGGTLDGTKATFNGTTGLVISGDFPADGATAFTWCGWVKVTTSGDYRTLFSKYDETAKRFEVSLGKTGEYGSNLGIVVAVNSAAGYTADNALSTTVRKFVAVVYDGGQGTANDRIKIYVDGSLQSKTVDGTFPTALSSLTEAEALIGARSNATLYFSGEMDGVALFDSALTGTNISDLFAADSAGGVAPTVGHLSLGGKVATVTQGEPHTVAPSIQHLALTGYAPVVANAAITLTAATVSASGGSVALTFSGSVSLVYTALTVKANGTPVRVSAVSGSGTSWTATLDRRWIRSGATVVVTYGGANTTATNSSTVTDAQIRYIGRGYGMFVHWGIETFLDLEWSVGNESPNTFAPTASVADGIDQWIAAAIAGGMKYMVLTSKHHGGFCLWPSSTTTHDIAASSWYSGAGSPNIVRLFVDKVRAAGLGVGLYYSVWDRNWEAANSGFTGAAYTSFAQSQLTELLSDYGPIDLIWIDGWGWGLNDGNGVEFTTIPFDDLYDHIKGIQPKCQVLVNTHEGTLTHSDIAVFEAGSFGGATPSDNLLVAELADTIRSDDKWFWKTSGDGSIGAAAVAGGIATNNGRRAAYLLNCPPARDALLPAVTVADLVEAGYNTFEEVLGISSVAGTAATRTVSLTLTTDGSTAAANLTGLSWAFWDQTTPAAGIPPVAQGKNATTNGSGVFTVSVVSSLAAGGIGWLTVTDSDGDPDTNHGAFAGPVEVS